MYLMRNHDVWIYVRCANSDPRIAFDRLSHDIATLYRILRFLQNYGAVLITTETNLRYELFLTGLESRVLARAARNGKRVPWEVAVDAD